MAGQRQADGRTDTQKTIGKVLKQRGILMVAGAAVAGIVAKQTAPPVVAS